MGCAAGLATLDVYEEENLLEETVRKGKILGEILEGFKSKYACVGDVRYIGLFSCIELVKSKKTKEPVERDIMGKLVGMLKSKGFFNYFHDNNLFVSPPLIITDEELKDALSIMDEVLASADTIIA